MPIIASGLVAIKVIWFVIRQRPFEVYEFEWPRLLFTSVQSENIIKCTLTVVAT